MIRAFILLVVFVLGVLATPPPARASTDTAFTTDRLNAFGQVAVRAGQLFGIDVTGLIMPNHTKPGDIAHPDHQPTAGFKSTVAEFFTPQNYKDDGKHIDWDPRANPIFYTILYGIILHTDAQYSTHPPATDCMISVGNEQSEDIPFATVEMQKAQELGAFIGLHQVDPNESGIVDFNRPPKVLQGMNPGEDCKRHDAGLELPPAARNDVAFSTFGPGTEIVGEMTQSIFDIVQKIIDGVVTPVRDYLKVREESWADLTMKKREPHYNCLGLDAGGPGNEQGECGGEAALNGGFWTAAFLREEDMKPVESSSYQPYKVELAKDVPIAKMDAAYDLVNIQKVRMSQAACTSVPDTTNTSYNNIQDTAMIGGFVDAAGILGAAVKPAIENMINIGEVCSPTVGSCSSTELPDLSGANPACSLCNTSMPKTFVDIFNRAASEYNVPASVLYSLFVSEGSDYRWQWTEANTVAWSVCGGEVPSCDEFATATGARGPFSFLSTPTGSGYDWSPDYFDASKVVDPNRTEFSPCNLLDATFAAAAKLQHESGGATAGYTPPSCWGYTLHSPGVPGHLTIASSCADSSWTEARIATGVRQFTGYCTETAYTGPGGYSGAQTADNNHFKRAFDYYSQYRCQ